MQSLNHLSVRRKLTLIIMIISTVSLLMASVAFITSDRLYSQKNLGENLRLVADMISAGSVAALLFGDPAAAAETLGFLESRHNIEHIVIYDADDRVFAAYRREGYGGAVPEAQAANLLFWDNHVELFSDIRYQGERIGTIFLRSDLRMMNDRLVWFLGIVGVVLATSLLVAFSLSAQLQHIITTPLSRLSNIARRVSTERNYSLRVSGEGKDELGALIVDFNAMLEEIEHRDARLKRHQEDLEARVASRTRELEIANRELASSRDQAEEVAKRMEYHAHHDALTGLPNRILLNDRIRTELAHARRNREMLAVLFLDLDRFKIINDSLGHATGDQLLRIVSQRLQGCLRANDTVARLGGDEFMVLLPRISSTADAGRLGNKIIASINEPMSCNNHELHISTSIGISIYPHDGTDAETLVKHADISMYRAKELGRNKVAYYTADMDAGSRRRLGLESRLRKALSNDELELNFQPKIDIQENRIAGFEALLRWNNADFGRIAPQDFIPIAEDSGLITPIGEWMLHTAFTQLREWHERGFRELDMAVNLSSVQLAHPGFENILEGALVGSGIDPHHVELEITENAAMKNIDSAATTLRKLKKTGVRVAMDDFGTGYSSLSYLRKLPIDTVKLDRSFVSDIPDNGDDALIAQAIIALTGSLGMSLVVEGVEDVRQLNFFRQHGCRYAQGFLFSEALSASEVTELLGSQYRPGTLNLAG